MARDLQTDDITGIDIQSAQSPVAACKYCGKPCYLTVTRAGSTVQAHPCCLLSKASKRNPCPGCKASESAGTKQDERSKTKTKRR